MEPVRQPPTTMRSPSLVRSEQQETVEICLEACRENHCLLYQLDGAKDRCLDLVNPCTLTRDVVNGFRCKRGFHDEVDDQ